MGKERNILKMYYMIYDDLCFFFELNQSHKPVLSEAIWLLHIIVQLHVQLVVQRITTIAAQHTLGTKIHYMCDLVACNHSYKRMTEG